MLLDFYLLGALFFHTRLQPILGESWRRRSFAPCRELCTEVLALGRAQPDGSLLAQVVRGLPFARQFWQGVAGELLLLAAEDMPLVQTAPATLCCLLAPARYLGSEAPRSAFAPIEQVHFGSRDLRFGGACYRPEHAGYNATEDVARLLRYLEAIDAGLWSEAMLSPMAEFATAEERAEELAFVRDWFEPLVGVYRDAARRQCVVVCERR
jgi:hypothetical protein